MEGSEPSLAPEWLRSNGGGNHSASSASQTDGPSSLLKRNKSIKSISNLNGRDSSFLERDFSTNYRRGSSSNGCDKHDRKASSRPYSSFTRIQPTKDRGRLSTLNAWDYEDSDTLKGIVARRSEKDALRRSQSMISRRPNEPSQRKVFTNLRNSCHNINGNGDGVIKVDSSNTGILKVSTKRELPLLGPDERHTASDIVRVPAPGISKGVQGLSIGTSSLVGSEDQTSALADAAMGVGSNSSLSSRVPWASPNTAGAAVSGPFSAPSGGAFNGLSMAEALVKVPESDYGPQEVSKAQRSMDLPFMVSKQLIPVTPSMPKPLVQNPSDKLKLKTTSKPTDAGGPKKSSPQISSLQLGNLSTCNGSARGDGLSSSSTGKMLLLKPSRENGASAALNGDPCQTVNGTSMIVNGSFTAASSVASAPLKNPDKAKLPSTGLRTSAYGLNAVSVVDKRLSVAQVQSRKDFFNLMRKKSTGGTLSTGSGVPSSNPDELKEQASDGKTVIANGNDLKCNGDACSLAEISSDCKESDLSEDAFIYSNEEEKAFLRSLGWEENTGDDEALTEEEINGFYQKYMECIPASKLFRGSRLKMTQSDQSPCSAAAS